MKSLQSTSYRAALMSASLIILIGVNCAPARAQLSGISADDVRRNGDQITDQFANFMRGIFGSGAPHAPSRFNGQPSQQQQPVVAYPQPSTYQPDRSSGSGSTSQRQSRSRSTQSSPPTTRRTSDSAAVKAPKPTTSKSGGTASTKKASSNDNSNYASSKRSSKSGSSKTTTSARPDTQVDEQRVVHAPPPAPPADASPKPVSAPPSKAPEPKPVTFAPTPTPPSPPPTPSPTTTSTTPPAKPSTQNFPTGTASSKPGRVISPYPPNNELDVRGLPSGSLALDPTTQKIFKVP